MEPSADIHVGDIGTVYQVPVYDDDLTLANFNPSTALVLKIIFSMPQVNGGVATIERTASAVQVTINGVAVWCLQYTVLTADVATMHIAPGYLQLQGYLEMADGRKWRSNVITMDSRDRLLQIVANL